MSADDLKVVLITGCSTGIGKSIAQLVHRSNDQGLQKYRVISTARRLESLSTLKDMGITCMQLDVTSDKSVSDCVQKVLNKYGRIDCLINNAGISCLGPVVEQPISELEMVLSCNVVGVVRVIQAVVPSMMHRRQGLVINIGSITSTMTTPWSGAYSASKAALMNLTDALRLELKPFGVDVVITMTGAVKTNFAENIAASSDFERYEDTKTSLYTQWAPFIRSRAQASLQANAAKTPAEAATQIFNRMDTILYRNAKAPTWFFVGGNAVLYYCLGLWQKLFGWPVNNILSKRNGL